MDAELGDRAVFGDMTLNGGTGDGYYLYIDELENEHWLPYPEDEAGYFDASGLVEYYKLDGDLYVTLYDGEAEADSVIVEDWSDGELGIHLTLIDNRPEGGDNNPQLFDGGGELAAADGANPKTGARAMLAHADIFQDLSLDDGGAFHAVMGHPQAAKTPAVAIMERVPENIVSTSVDEVALMGA